MLTRGVYIYYVYRSFPLLTAEPSYLREDREDRDEMKVTTMSIMVTLDII